MRKRLDAWDEALRRALTSPTNRAARAAVCLLALAAYAALLALRMGVLLPEGGALARAATLLCLLAPVALSLFFLSGALSRDGAGLLPAVCAALCVLCGAAMRLAFLPHVSSDYEVYLSDWLAKFASMSFGESMRAGVGEYNALYQYILFLASRLPVPPMYAVKAASLLGDALLAGAAAHLGAREGRGGTAALCAALLLPSVALNGAMFCQCDSLYAACALWGLALALEGRGAPSAACFALSLAFKLQAAFALPVVLALYAARKLRLSDALVFLGALALCALPALLGGKPLGEFVGIYASQTGLYTGLTYNAPTLFGLMSTQGLDVYAYGLFGIALAFGACMLLTGRAAQRAETMADGGFVRLAFALTLSVVFCLPRMHERYFYLAGAFGLCAAARDRRLLPCAALVELASLSRLIDMGLSLRAASLLMLAALALLFALPEGEARGEAPGAIR